MPNEVWDQTTYPFSNFNGAATEVYKYISMLELKSIYASERDP